jgi:hypothetical protein
MLSHALVILLSTLATANAGPYNLKIKWGPCTADINSSAVVTPVECGILAVPLDYTEPNSNETLDLELLRVLALNQPSKGSILFNFGGPGDPGRELMAAKPELWRK